jgi:hypothetical protein
MPRTPREQKNPNAMLLGGLSARAKRKNLAPGERRMTKKERKAVRALASMGGHARAASLTPEDRQAIAKKAAAARWRDKTKPPYNL